MKHWKDARFNYTKGKDNTRINTEIRDRLIRKELPFFTIFDYKKKKKR